jgi:hypothetical protein
MPNQERSRQFDAVPIRHESDTCFGKAGWRWKAREHKNSFPLGLEAARDGPLDDWALSANASDSAFFGCTKAAVGSAPTVEALTVWPFCFFTGDAVSSIGDQRSAVQAFVSRLF